MTLLRVQDGLDELHHRLYAFGQALVKEGGDVAVAYAMSGMLYVGGKGQLCLSVPNALVRGVFAAIDEPGIELPPNDRGLDAHITVMKAHEIAASGGPDKITERGKRFHYRLGGLVTAEPEGWPGVAKVWLLRVYSPELQSLRKSYGLTPLPNDNQFDFHVTVAVRKRGVLGRNETSKVATPG